jgi:hypothetical protein
MVDVWRIAQPKEDIHLKPELKLLCYFYFIKLNYFRVEISGKYMETILNSETFIFLKNDLEDQRMCWIQTLRRMSSLSMEPVIGFSVFSYSFKRGNSSSLNTFFMYLAHE